MGLLDFRHRQPASTASAAKDRPSAVTIPAPAEPAETFWSKLNAVASRYAYDGKAEAPGVPGAPDWYEAKAPLSPMKLVGGVRQITGGGRRSF